MAGSPAPVEDTSIQRRSAGPGESARTASQQLVLACFSSGSKSGRHRLDELLDGGPDWNHVIAVAREQHVLPAVAAALGDIEPPRVPEQVHARLRTESLRRASCSMSLAAELVKVLKDLADAGIRAVSLKGPALAADLYGSPSLRHYDDLDILVSPADWDGATQCLIRMGYEVESWPARTPDHEIRLVRPGKPFAIDLHRSVMPSWCGLEWTLDQLEGRLNTVTVYGTEVATLGPEDLILFLTVHAAKHCWRKLKWVADIAAFVGRFPELDWESVVGAANRLHCRRRLVAGVAAACDLADRDVPAAVARAMQLDVTAFSVARAASDSLPEGFRGIGEFRMSLIMQDGWRDRLRAWRELLAEAVSLTEADRQTAKLPRAFSGLHYLIRPVRLVYAYGPEIARQLLPRTWQAGLKSRAG